jgi:hypothetical protein
VIKRGNRFKIIFKKKKKKKGVLFKSKKFFCISLSLSFIYQLKMKDPTVVESTENNHDKEKISKSFLPDIKKSIKEAIPQVRWAPLHGIPFERRLQTAVVLVWIFLLGNCLILFGLSFLTPVLWPLDIAYIIYLWRDQAHENGGRRSDWFRRLPFWSLFAGYFPIKLVKVRAYAISPLVLLLNIYFIFYFLIDNRFEPGKELCIWLSSTWYYINGRIM